MSNTRSPVYRKLALDSSNEMMDYDGDWGLGRYSAAVLHIREAGFGRVQMGQLAFDEGDFVRAAGDWLSAAACFYLVPDLERMRDALSRVQQLHQQDRIPPERRDLHAALQEREEQLRSLEQKLTRFRQEYEQLLGSTQSASQDALDFLLRHLRELPGLPYLHVEIYHQARRLGQSALAAEHLGWAEKFDPGNPDYRAFRATPLVAS